MWGWLGVVLGFIKDIFIGIIGDALKTPAIEISVEEADGVLEIPATPADDILDRYSGVFSDRD